MGWLNIQLMQSSIVGLDNGEGKHHGHAATLKQSRVHGLWGKILSSPILHMDNKMQVWMNDRKQTKISNFTYNIVYVRQTIEAKTSM